MPTYLIYRVLNLVTRKIYIGRTTVALSKRWSVHKAHAKYWERYHRDKNGRSAIARSVAKYGPDAFDIIEIDRARDFAHMVWLEAFYIRYYNTTDSRYGYNLIIDKYGDGREFTSDETKRKTALAAHRNNAPCGVTWDKERKRWSMVFAHMGVVAVDRFDDPSDAKCTWDRLVLHAFGDDAILHYPDLRATYLKEDLKAFWVYMTTPRQTTSRYKGVKRTSGRWDVRIGLPNGKRLFLGCYDTEIQAAICFDKVAMYLGRSPDTFNLPELVTDTYFSEGEAMYGKRADPRKRIDVKGGVTSRFRGVSKRSPRTWEMSIDVGGKRVREVYGNERLASYAFDYHARAYGFRPDILNHPDVIVAKRPTPMPVNLRTNNAQRAIANEDQLAQLRQIEGQALD